MTTFHSLPPELVDEILRSDELSIRNLVQCCLVSHQFLPSARRSLYSTIDLWLEKRGNGDPYVLDLPSSKLLATIRQNLSLGRICTCLLVKTRLTMSVRQRAIAKPSLPEVIDEWFILLPNLTMFWSPYTSHDRFRSNLSRFGGEKWTALNLNLRCSENGLKDLPKSATLKKLGCRDFFVHKADKKWGFPSSVITLDLGPASYSGDNYGQSAFDTLHPPPGSQVRNLRIKLGGTRITHLAEYSCLEYLSIHDIDLHHHDLSLLAGITRLRRLRLAFWIPNHVHTSLHELLLSLPRSIYRLDFSREVPFDVLFSLLQPGTDVSFSQLGLREFGATRSNGGELDHLRDLCAHREIELIYLGEKDPIFDF